MFNINFEAKEIFDYELKVWLCAIVEAFFYDIGN